jgi:homotetrameric cytidine deaminase
MPARTSSIHTFRDLAADAAAHAHVPYSNRPEAVVLVLRDGRWIPGVRVESASFSLTLSPLLNAVTTAVAMEAGPIAAAVGTRPFRPSELAFAASAVGLAGFNRQAPDVLSAACDLPAAAERISPFVAGIEDAAPSRGSGTGSVEPSLPVTGLSSGDALSLARRIAGRAHAPASDFPVGCLLEISGAGYIPGVNVEHEDWMHILCAERNAIGTAVSFGYRSIAALYLCCPDAPGCTPCGACRQLMAELAPTSTLWMDGENASPATSSPVALLPSFYAGPRFLSNT